MTAADLVDRLAEHKTLGAAPREELAWLASRGTLRQLHPGDVLTPKGAHPKGLFVVLSGCLAIFVDRGAGLKKIMEWREGAVTGLLPYSRLVGPPGDSVAQEPSEILEVHRDHLRAMTHECYEITSILVHAMIDRVRTFTSSDLHDEKMVSLGKLSAGLRIRRRAVSTGLRIFEGPPRLGAGSGGPGSRPDCVHEVPNGAQVKENGKCGSIVRLARGRGDGLGAERTRRPCCSRVSSAANAEDLPAQMLSALPAELRLRVYPESSCWRRNSGCSHVVPASRRRTSSPPGSPAVCRKFCP